MLYLNQDFRCNLQGTFLRTSVWQPNQARALCGGIVQDGFTAGGTTSDEQPRARVTRAYSYQWGLG